MMNIIDKYEYHCFHEHTLMYLFYIYIFAEMPQIASFKPIFSLFSGGGCCKPWRVNYSGNNIGLHYSWKDFGRILKFDLSKSENSYHRHGRKFISGCHVCSSPPPPGFLVQLTFYVNSIHTL